MGVGSEQVIASTDFANIQYTILSGTQVIATTSSVPEPSTLALLGPGIALLGLRLKIHRENRTILAKR